MTSGNIQKDIFEKDPKQIVEIIVLYHGDILKIESELNVAIEVLNSNYAIITLEIEKIPELLNYSEIEYIETPKELKLELNESVISSCIPPVTSENGYGLTGEGVIVAIIDSGIDYTHLDFRNEDNSSRILFIYDQTLSGKPPKGFNIGTEYSNIEINNALENKEPFSVIPQIDFIGHGTAVTGIATGNGRESNGTYVGVAPKSDIIAVKIGETGESLFAKTTQLMRAMKYVVEKAELLNKPVAINISWGTNDGPHNGNTLFENYINDISQIWKSSICVATGNEADFGHHYFDKLNTGETIDVNIFTTGMINEFYISIWKNFSDDFSVELILPDNKTTGEINFINKADTYQFGNITVNSFYGQPTNYNVSQEIYLRVSAREGSLPLGLWNLRIKSGNIVDGDINIWLPSSISLKDNTYFSKPSIDTTLTLPSTASSVISVGGYNHITNSVTSFSGRGYTVTNVFVKPDLVAPAVNIFTASIDGGYDSFTGTSMAAPFVTGSAALMLQWGIVNNNDSFLYGQRIKAFLRKGANREDNIEYPNKNFGYGALCLKNTMDYLSDYGMELTIPTISEIEDIESSLSFEEFLKLPTTVGFTSVYSSQVQDYIKDNPYIRMGPIIQNYVVAYANEKYINMIYTDLGKDNVYFLASDLSLLDIEANTATGITQVQLSPFLDLRGKGVIIGFVDTGIDYTKDAFKYEDGTSKIKYIWDQTIIDGIPPEKYKYGAVYTQDDINIALASNNPLEVVPSVDEVGHGTFLASVAAGREKNQYIGAAPDSEIICVKVRRINDYYIRRYNLIFEGDIPEDLQKSNIYGTIDFILGIQFVLDKAIELNKPVVICIGMGTNFGNHDGGTVLERYISTEAEIKGRAFITAAGNESNTKRHNEGMFTNDGEIKTIGIRKGEKKSTIVCYIWTAVSDVIAVSVKSPTGEVVPKVPIKVGAKVTELILENSIVSISYSRGQSNVAIVRIRTSISGIWEITLYAEKILIGNYNAWLKIPWDINDDIDIEFIDPNPNKTIVVPATAIRTITCGAYNSFDSSLYVASSWGPTNLPRLSPDFVAPGVNVKGVYPTGYGTMSGTSVAAAITSGAAALLLEWGIVNGNEPSMDTDRIRALLISGCRRDLNIQYPNFQWGFGKINLVDTFKFLSL